MMPIVALALESGLLLSFREFVKEGSTADAPYLYSPILAERLTVSVRSRRDAVHQARQTQGVKAHAVPLSGDPTRQ